MASWYHTVTVYHYTNEDGKDAILDTGYFQMSTDTTRDAYLGKGVYFTSMSPFEHGREEITFNNWQDMRAISKTNYVFEVELRESNLRAHKAKKRDVYVFGLEHLRLDLVDDWILYDWTSDTPVEIESGKFSEPDQVELGDFSESEQIEPGLFSDSDDSEPGESSESDQIESGEINEFDQIETGEFNESEEFSESDQIEPGEFNESEEFSESDQIVSGEYGEFDQIQPDQIESGEFSESDQIEPGEFSESEVFSESDQSLDRSSSCGSDSD